MNVELGDRTLSFCFGKKRLHNFISGNTSIGTRHLYWILIGPSIAVYVLLFKTAIDVRVQYVQCTVFAEECNAAAYMIIRLLLVIYKTNDQIIATPRGCAYY
jgi:hypothetical protein